LSAIEGEPRRIRRPSARGSARGALEDLVLHALVLASRSGESTSEIDHESIGGRRRGSGPGAGPVGNVGRRRRGQGTEGDGQGVVRPIHRRRTGRSRGDRPVWEDGAQDGGELCRVGQEGRGRGLQEVQVPQSHQGLHAARRRLHQRRR